MSGLELRYNDGWSIWWAQVVVGDDDPANVSAVDSVPDQASSAASNSSGAAGFCTNL